MAKQNKFVKYARTSDVDTQSFYIEDDARLHLADELKSKGTRRILVVCNDMIRKLRPFDEFANSLADAGFRLFVYSEQGEMLNDTDIEAGLKIYHEYNCDTIIAIGGTSEIDCGKLIAACVTNPVKSLTQLAGVNKLSNDIPALCTIMTENCASSTTASAEFYDTVNKKWRMVLSAYLVPHMVVIDTELSERISHEHAVSSAFTALCLTIEAYISPVAKLFPEFRASAINSSLIIFKNLEKFCNNTTDSFLRKQIAVAGFYAGLSTRKTGVGYAHIIMHTLIGKYGVTHGQGLTKILLMVLEEQLGNADTCAALAELARASHFCSQGLSNEGAAESLIDNLRRLDQKVAVDLELPRINPDDIDSLVTEIEKEARMFVLSKDIDTKALSRILAVFV